MATKPAHVKLAQQKGAEAGFNRWHEYAMRNTNNGTNGLEPLRAQLAEAHKIGGYSKRTGEFKKPEKALAFYCNAIQEKWGFDPREVVPAKRKSTTSRKARSTSGATPARSAKAGAVAPDTDDNVEALRKLIEAGFSIDDALEIVNTRAGSTSSTAVENDDDTDEDDDTEDTTPAPSQYAPSEKIVNDPATNGRLWKLNSLGLLRIVDFDEMGDPITNAEAHEAIAEALS